MKYLMEKISEDKLLCWTFAFLVFTAEIFLTFANIFISFTFYLFIFISLLVIASFKYQQPAYSLYLSLALVPLIRIISISTPLSGIPEVFGLAVVSIPLFITGAIVVKMVGLTYTDLGFGFDRFHRMLLIGLLGIQLGFVKVFIHHHGKINTSTAPEGLLMWVLVFIISVGLLEEFLFRGILYNVFSRVLGCKTAAYFISLLYATLTISTKSFLNVISAFLISIIFCQILIWEKSLIGLSLAHGLISITLYAISPPIFSSGSLRKDPLAMAAIITHSTEAFSRGNVSTVLTIDLIVILILIGLLIVQEFRKLNSDQCWLFKSDNRSNIGSIIYMAIVPFLYIFIYVLLYKALQISM